MEKVDFVAIDFETANAKLSSICQIGISVFRDGVVADSFESLVDPEDYFAGINVSIHGIDSEMVRGAPTFSQLYPKIVEKLSKNIVVSHTAFDRTAMRQSVARYQMTPPDCRWLDTAKIVRRVWADCARSGYGLASICSRLDIKFAHHNALEDARASGMVLLSAMAVSGMTLADCLVRADQPLSADLGGRIARDGNPDGPLYGEVIVFTGALSMVRQQAADMAAAAGCTVDPGVTKHTTLLVVGDQDVAQLSPGHSKSNKHLKTEALIAKGQMIRILQESDFLQLVEHA